MFHLGLLEKLYLFLSFTFEERVGSKILPREWYLNPGEISIGSSSTIGLVLLNSEQNLSQKTSFPILYPSYYLV